jgi:hypothetical protein
MPTIPPTTATISPARFQSMRRGALGGWADLALAFIANIVRRSRTVEKARQRQTGRRFSANRHAILAGAVTMYMIFVTASSRSPPRTRILLTRPGRKLTGQIKWVGSTIPQLRWGRESASGSVPQPRLWAALGKTTSRSIFPYDASKGAPY